MKVAYLQFAPALLDRAETEARLAPLLKQAREADLVVLPELANSGYAFDNAAEAARCAEECQASPFLDFLHQHCRAHDLAIASGFCEREGDRLYNSAVLVDANGLNGLYRKLHLFNREKEFFTPGDRGVPVFDLAETRIAMLVCFDWAFPEVWRLAALAGAELIAHPANFVLTGFAQQAVPVHAITNGLFVATANRVGRERSLRFTGNSLIVDPRGTELARAGDQESRVEIVELDPQRARDKGVTERNDLLADRRPEVYAELCRQRRDASF